MDSKHAKTFVSFANTKGGQLFLGVEDDGTVTGHNLSNDTKAKIEQVAGTCDPAVHINLESVDLGDGKSVTVVDVPQSPNAPHRCTQGYFLRVGSESIKMSTEQLTDYLNEHGKLGFDERIRADYQWSQIYNSKTVSTYKSYLSPQAQQLSDDSILSNLRMIKDTHATNAGILFFSNNATDQLLQFKVRCVAYNGTDTGSPIIDHKDFGENILEVIEASVQFIKRHLNTSLKVVGMKSVQTLEIPEEALREVIVNAVVHRDYNIKGANIKVEVFSDRLEVSSPGGLPSGMALEDLGKKSLARNPIIADVLSRTPYMEKLGTGINRIADALTDAKLNKAIYQSSGFFTVTLQRTPHVTPQVTPQVEKLILALEGEMKSGELRAVTGYKDRENFRKNIIQVAVRQSLIEMTIPEKPQSRSQKYRLTALGKQLKAKLHE
jgi:ATP-dependent DNA helicase RecG